MAWITSINLLFLAALGAAFISAYAAQRRKEAEPPIGQLPAIPPEPAEDRKISEAWQVAALLLPSEAGYLAIWRLSCARLLHAARRDGASRDVMAHADMLRRHLPAVTQIAAARMSDAAPAQRHVIVADLVCALAALAERAEALSAGDAGARVVPFARKDTGQ